MTRRLLSIVFAILCIPAIVAADTFRVIVNRDNPVTTLKKAQVSKLLLKTQTTWSNGNKVMPVDLRATSKVRDAMSRSIHGRSAAVIKNWWNQQIFAGKGVPPPERATDAMVIAYVLSNPGAVGYVSTEANTSDVKVVVVKE
ncbi:MAG: substrate-binding domain-containing protein [Kofleriaceae bacterium]|nr:substrate-binding domain-containing protein [Kofleriaceae bacterium]